ncbi:hypothetical protein ACWDWO_11185 [Actinopolymorpha singaporensis]|uniref:DNA-binding transcriptional regulator of glucitol operon n=1 Tax=Actinopolymorpha singaporensis TaxID=117157 RepID=A0A1H1YPL1_9ACTN|nr:hypothetical protein [Actinopolymorpha singaporensis]SDT23415.1 hypothetical protein SAMN04489717_5624 [Actinopolymorpha singaporensis]
MDDKPGASTPADSEESRPTSTSLLRRLLSWQWVAFTLVVVLAVAAFLFLAWWQLGRFESRTGDWQNFGYALQWPFFAVFAVYVWWRLLRESRRGSSERETANARPGPEVGARPDADRRTGDELTELPPLPPKRLVRPDVTGVHSTAGSDVAGPSDGEDGTDEAALTAYNRYLAALQKRSAAAGRPAGHSTRHSDGRPLG